MFWRPKTRTEWALVVGVVLLTLVWAVLRGTWATPAGFVHSFSLDTNDARWGRFAGFPPRDLLFMVPLWLFYGFLRVQVRKRQPGVGAPANALDGSASR